MNRIIKFRAWDRELRIMRKVVLMNTACGNPRDQSIYFCDDIGKGYSHASEVDLMQFTGLRDCKRTEEYPEGQEIYEGDVVCCYDGEYCQGYWEHDHTITIDNMINDCFMMGESENLKVIGNIYENPELLEGKQ